jgi:DNA-binding NarL/FixJ family response regulator
MIRIFLADDHEIVLGGLIKLIAENPDMSVVGTATDGRRTLQRTLEEGLDWDLLILDLSLPRVGGMEILQRIKEARPLARVIILSMYPEEQYAVQLLRAGADAYLSKAAPPESLLSAIRAVAGGASYTSEAISRKLHSEGSDEQPQPHRNLSAREFQVFNLLIEGQSVTDIAAQLDLSPSTVSNHVAAIRNKLSVRTVAEVVRYAHRVGLID